MKKLLPLILIIMGGGAGVAAGLVMKPAPEAEVAAEAPAEAATPKEESIPDAEDPKPGELSFEYVRLKNQFVLPVVRDEIVRSVVVISLSLEVTPGSSDVTFSVEPRLRDGFLQTMFDHAAIGGFDGAFANNQNLKRLRRALKESAYAVLGDRVNDVLITDIVRQDM